MRYHRIAQSLIAVGTITLGTFALSAVVAETAGAQLIGAPVPANSGNQFPFGSPVGANKGTRYQQVYASTEFTAGLITGVRFFRTSATNGTGNVSDAQWQYALSTTSKAVNQLSRRNFQSNLGADNATVTVFETRDVNIPFGGSYTINFDVPFYYDPTLGNLLLDISVNNIAKRGDVFFDSHFDTFGNISSRSHDFGAGFESTGMVTEFLRASSTVVPEPSTYAMMAGGLLALGVAGRRKRKIRPRNSP